MEFEWDPDKDRENQRKHGLSFEEASTLFTGEDDYLELYDDYHSEDEERFIAIGVIIRGVVVVVWTEPSDRVIRIISARPATQREKRTFQRYRDQA
ncbi:MAG: BrnT family toxin [Myxococcota bacterium]